MLENLKLALKKQKKLIVIFLLTIFLPSLSLGVFGIRAIKSERFRQAKQLESEQRRLAEGLKSRVSTELRELGLVLQNLAESPVCQNRDDKTIADMVRVQLANNPLVETAFYYYENEEPRFPAFHGALSKPSLDRRSFSPGPLQGILDKANENEFVTKDYGKAIILYREIGRRTKDHNIQAQMLYNEARCLVKLERYAEAIEIFGRIGESVPESVTASGVPIALMSQLETVHCYQALGNIPNALKTGLGLFRDIIDMRWILSEAQFNTYTSLVEGAIEEIRSQNPANPNIESLSAQYAELKTNLRDKNKEWTVINAIQQEILPDLRRKQSSPVLTSPIRYSKTMGDRAFLVLASSIFGGPGTDAVGLFGLTIKESYLLNDVLAEAMVNEQSNGQTKAVISDLEGRILLGKDVASEGQATLTEFFNENFPPWKIEFHRSQAEGIGFAGLKSSFYFWTILTLVVILVFGAVLISRTIAHEMEILKLKSDFVSSVSHEFKTPLTSIKALTERLQSDKVSDGTKMKQYFSMISQNADQLTRLVKNLLDFSKIEEGKIEYSFVLTDIGQLVSRQVQDFAKNDIQKSVRIRALIPDDIPHLYVDQEAFSQAINNLIDNACKFSPIDKEVEVRVEEDGESVIIEVADRGIGIPQDEQEKIFEKFYQARNAVKHSAKGTGLGLTLVKHTAEAHGGWVSVRSKVGEGSVFSLTLPIERK